MEAIQGHFSDIVFDKLFLIEVKSVRDEGMLVAIVIVISMVTPQRSC